MADITGVVRIGGVLAQAEVSCYNYSTKALVSTQTSAVDGTFSFTGLTVSVEYYLTYLQILGDIWSASTVYSVGDLVRPTTPTGFVYKCISAGTGGAAEPTFPTTLNATFADGGALLKAQAYCVKPSGNGPYFPV